MMLRIALLFLVGLLFGSSAQAYPATSSTEMWRHTGFGTAGCVLPATGYTYGSATAACQSAPLQNVANAYDGACGSNRIIRYLGSYGGDATNPQCHYEVKNAVGTIINADAGIGNAQKGTGYTCPNGGTLSGTTCTCGPTETDTGSACVAGPTCAADEWNDGGTCAKKCPAAGTAWSPDDHASTFLNTGIQFPRGRSTACMAKEYGVPSGGFSASCEVENTSSVQVCDDDGCWGEFGRHTGRMCSSTPPAPADVPALADPTPTTCESGDLWCVSDTGSCGSGYTTGTVNGTTICAATGQTIGITPQPQSPNSPPPSTNLQPNSWTSPSARTGESINSSQRVVVSIGAAATQWPGTGTGGDGEGDGECGLPDTPPCKIDETGTPNGSGVSDQQAGVNSGAQSLGDALEGVEDGTTKPNNIGWGITSIMFPTNCTPMTIGPFGNWGEFVIDMCQFQPIVHDLMSLVWVSFGLIFSVGMVFRTVATGGA